jgi:hypothetical protein
VDHDVAGFAELDRPLTGLHGRVRVADDQPIAVPGDGAQLGQQRRGWDQRAPVPVFVAQRVSASTNASKASDLAAAIR